MSGHWYSVLCLRGLVSRARVEAVDHVALYLLERAVRIAVSPESER